MDEKNIAKIIHKYLQEILSPLVKRVKALESNQQKTMADFYRGIYKDGGRYLRGELVTTQGGLWLCLHPTSGRPGKSGNWRLVAKGSKP